MARIRTIKPEFWSNELLSDLPESTHLLAAAVLNYADDEGYFNANPALVKAACFPIREPAVSIPESLQKLHEIGYIRLGDMPNGRVVGQVVNFSSHQKVSHPAPTRFNLKVVKWRVFGDSCNPPEFLQSPPENFRSPPEFLQSPPEVLRPDLGSRNREQGRGKEEDYLKGNLSLVASTEPECSAASEHACRTSDDETGEVQVTTQVEQPPEEPEPKATARDSKRQPPALPPVMVFPCRGKQDKWALQAVQLERWREQYPGIDILAECRKALAWVEASPSRRKSASGMQRYLVSWLNRVADRPSPSQESRSWVRSASGAGAESFAAEKQRLGRRSNLYLTLKTELKLPEFHARHLSAEFDHLLTEEEAVKAAIESLVLQGIATFDGQRLKFKQQQEPEFETPRAQARIGQEQTKPRGQERHGLVTFDDLLSESVKDKSA